VRHRHVVEAALLTSSIALGARVAQTQPIATDELRARGTAAYNQLPASVKMRDAPVFSDALRYLYAYEQRALREGDKRVHSGAENALAWLSSRIQDLKTGKSDKARSETDLRDRGLTMYEKARNSEQQNKIWDVPSFLSASANLFAYIQVASSPDVKARAAYQWLTDARSRLVVAGVGSADAAVDPEGWFPPKPRPDARHVVVTHVDAGSHAPIGSHVVTVAPPPPSRDSVRPPPPVSTDSTPAVGGRSHQADVDSAAKLYLQGRLREVRDLARGWLDANPNDGDAHMTLAIVYAKASGQGVTPEERAVRWLAIDHLTIAIKTRAIGYDPGVQMLKDLESHTPTAEDLKARGWVAGQRLRVSFAPYEWIDEETTIRPRKE
jgi:hypothetical protein